AYINVADAGGAEETGSAFGEEIRGRRRDIVRDQIAAAVHIQRVARRDVAEREIAGGKDLHVPGDCEVGHGAVAGQARVQVRDVRVGKPGDVRGVDVECRRGDGAEPAVVGQEQRAIGIRDDRRGRGELATLKRPNVDRAA